MAETCCCAREAVGDPSTSSFELLGIKYGRLLLSSLSVLKVLHIPLQQIYRNSKGIVWRFGEFATRKVLLLSCSK
jgi:hypothetical protein